MPSAIASKHFAVVGATGSGKTLTLRLLMQDALCRIGQRDNPDYAKGHRALVYDAKQEYLPLLAGMKLRAPIVSLHPFDRRSGDYGITSAAWDIAADVTGPLNAHQVASILIGDEGKDSQPFFRNTARNLLRGVLVAFAYAHRQRKKVNLNADPWSFGDVILAMKSRKYMETVLASCPHTQELLEYTYQDRLYNDIRATLLTVLADYEPIAAAWQRPHEEGHRVSLRSWLNGEFILVLGSFEESRTALDAINRVLFKRLTELILAQPEPSRENPSRTWVFLDEVREAGKLDGLPRLLNQGRSKGACVVMGFQDIEGMRDVYGPYVANELVGQCGNKVILRADSPEMAEWASRLAGTKETMEEGGTVFFGPRNLFQGKVNQFVERKLLMASEIMSFPPTGRQNGLEGFYIVPDIGDPFRYTEFGERLFGTLLREADSRVAPFLSCAEEDEYLDTNVGRLAHLGFVPSKMENDEQKMNGEFVSRVRIKTHEPSDLDSP